MVSEASRVFEEEVRRIAREIFGGQDGYAPQNLDGRERDCVMVANDVVNIVEATRDPRKQKAQHDLEKCIELKRKLSLTLSQHNFHIWFVTDRDPTADQAAEAEAARKKARCPVTALSLSAFAAKLVDARAYIFARNNYPFGSVRNPDPSSPNKAVSDDQFIPLDLIEIDAPSNVAIQTQDLFREAQSAPMVNLIIGEYGAGKSMTMRHIYRSFSDEFIRGNTAVFPLFLNLRDHIGQDEPSSAIFDHGTKIGFSGPERLVRAWRAGFAHVFLDGFDEVVSSRFRNNTSSSLRAVRHSAMRLVRRFIEDHPSQNSSVFLSGRRNYFSNQQELISAFGLKSRRHKSFTLNEFTTEQVQDYLRRLGLRSDSVPAWLPSRPLLVAYLAYRGILGDDHDFLAQVSRADGWDYLLGRICDREGKQIEDLGGQTDLVRSFVDRLATKARSSTTGRGPISVDDLTGIFRQIFPATPDEAAQQLLLRMAGLTGAAAAASPAVAAALHQEDAREFVDDDLVDVARAGDVCRFVENPFDEHVSSLFSDKNAVICMGELGVEVAASRLRGLAAGQFAVALRRAVEQLGSATLAVDIINVMSELSLDFAKDKISSTIVIRDAYIEKILLEEREGMQQIVFESCVIGKIETNALPPNIRGPKFRGCLVETLSGVISVQDLPAGIIAEDVSINDILHEAETNRDIRQRDFPPGVRVLIVSLRKLFLQHGSGRKETAFVRGLDEVERSYVPEVLELIRKHGLATPQRIRGPAVWIPNRAARRLASDIIQSPHQVTHPVVAAAASL